MNFSQRSCQSLAVAGSIHLAGSSVVPANLLPPRRAVTAEAAARAWQEISLRNLRRFMTFLPLEHCGLRARVVFDKWRVHLPHSVTPEANGQETSWQHRFDLNVAPPSWRLNAGWKPALHLNLGINIFD